MTGDTIIVFEVFCQHWFKKWLVDIRRQSISWINRDVTFTFQKLFFKMWRCKCILASVTKLPNIHCIQVFISIDSKNGLWPLGDNPFLELMLIWIQPTYMHFNYAKFEDTDVNFWRNVFEMANSAFSEKMAWRRIMTRHFLNKYRLRPEYGEWWAVYWQTLVLLMTCWNC